MISHVKEYQIESTTGFPFKLGTQNINGEDTVVPAELANNVAELHQYMFGDDDGEYAVSQNVESISNRIKSRTGYTSRSKYIVDTNKYNNTAGNNSTTGTIEKNEKSSKERE